ncbi:MAG TPA: hypothetical protein VMB73_11635 [Acetobacteraceae bacterium]|nr:hypothetical protein [Acetobacteraceae bacterium]
MSNFFGRLFSLGMSAPVERKVADLIAGTIEDDPFPDRVQGGGVPGGQFDAGMSYFGVRLCGMHMVDARHFATQVLPLCVCLAEFDYAGERRTVPFSIGPKEIQKRLVEAGVTQAKDSKPAWVELRNLTVLRPTPVTTGNLSLYTGLFSVAGQDLVKTLLDVVGTVGGAIGGTALAPGLKVAETVYDGFGTLLGLRDMTQVAAALIGNALTEDGSGYLLIANTSPAGMDMRQMRVVGGRLCWPKAGPKNGAPVYEFDHVLLALERFATVIAKDGLASSLFEKPWAETRAAIGTGKQEGASAALEKLQGAILASNDLTEDDRAALLGGYQKRYQQLADIRWPPKTAGAKGEGRRGAAADSLSVRVLGLASKADRNLATGLASVAKVLDQPSRVGVEPEQDLDAIIEAASAVRKGLGSRSRPRQLHGQIATALVRASFTQ